MPYAFGMQFASKSTTGRVEPKSSGCLHFLCNFCPRIAAGILFPRGGTGPVHTPYATGQRISIA